MKGRVRRNGSRLTNALRRILLRLYYSSTPIIHSPFCCGKSQTPSPKLQILVLGLPGVGKTTFCLKTCSNASDFEALTFTATNPAARESIMTFTQHLKRRCSVAPSTIVKYVELGGREPLVGGSKFNNAYAQSHGVILLLDLSFYPCQGGSLEILTSTLANPWLKGKPFLVTGSKLDRCLVPPVDLEEFTRAFDLRRLATEAQTQMMAMVMGRGPRKSQREIAGSLQWYISQVLERKEELDERIEVDMRKIATESQSRQVGLGGEVLLVEKLLEASKLSKRAHPKGMQWSSSSEEVPKIIEPVSQEFPSGRGDSTFLDEEELTEFQDEDEECWTAIASEQKKSLGQDETSDVSSEEYELEWGPMGAGTEMLHALLEPSWIRVVKTRSQKSKSLDDLCDDRGEIPLRRVSGTEDLRSLVDKEDGDGGFCDGIKMTSDAVFPYTKFEFTEVEFGPDIYSSLVGAGEPGKFQTILQEHESSTTPPPKSA